jgi:hypothetical protein
VDSNFSQSMINDLLRLIDSLETPWRKWARLNKRQCRIQQSEYLDDHTQILVLEPTIDEFTTVIIHPLTLAPARALGRDMGIINDNDLATMLAWHAITRTRSLPMTDDNNKAVPRLTSTTRLAEARASAQRRANNEHMPFYIWQHEDQYRVQPARFADPPVGWNMIETVEPEKEK